MKRNRVTVELVLDIPYNSNPKSFIKVTGGESVTTKNFKITKVEELEDELLAKELRHGQRMAVKKTIQQLLEKLGLYKYLYITIREDNDSNSQEYYVCICVRAPHSWQYADSTKTSRTFRIVDGKIFHRTIIGDKFIDTLADPNLQRLSKFLMDWKHDLYL